MRLISVIISLLLVGTALFGIYQIVVLFSNINDSNIKDGPNGSPGSEIFECKENITQNTPCFGLAMTTRNEWVAQSSLNPIDKLDLPTKNVVLTHTQTDECFMKAKCNYLVRTLQDDHTLWNDDIAYNFLISSPGDIYEGRGWLLQGAEVLEDLTKSSYLIGVIGNFSKTPVTEMQVKAVQHFIKHAQSIGKLISKHVTFCSTEILIPNNGNNSFLYTTGKYKECLN